MYQSTISVFILQVINLSSTIKPANGLLRVGLEDDRVNDHRSLLYVISYASNKHSMLMVFLSVQ